MMSWKSFIRLTACVALALNSTIADAQRCRFRCLAGETRDAGGCCIPRPADVQRPANTGPRCRRFEFRGAVEFEGYTEVRCDRIVFVTGATVRIRHGATLVLNAGRSIEVQRSATIDGRGDPGQNGAAGASVGGEWQSQGVGDYYAALNDCRARSDSRDRGGAGGPGGRGGPGATILLSHRPLGTLTILLSGGSGGPGGPGGGGRFLWRGDNRTCDGCQMNCPSGPVGSAGPSGEQGHALDLRTGREMRLGPNVTAVH